MSDSTSACPFSGGVTTAHDMGTTNSKWWPNQL
ncbi:MAG: hypothetical protein RL473_1676, partial [Actinomycetota bacterium]